MSALDDTYSLSTRWNAFRHTDGETMIAEIIEQTGLQAVELGYDLTIDLVPGVTRMVMNNAVRVLSVHNFCPVPIGAHRGHPELYLLGAPTPRERQGAIIHTTKTIQFAAEIGAKAVVCHAGYVAMKHLTPSLVRLHMEDQANTPKYEKTKMRLLMKRDKRLQRTTDNLVASLEQLIPVLEDAGVVLGLENLPAWESIPSEPEMDTLNRRLNSPWIRHWHDIGHGRIRQNLGLVAQNHWIEKLKPITAGFHIHDVKPPAFDHLPPSAGDIDFHLLAPLIAPGAIKVFEPSPGTPADALRVGIQHVQQAWAPRAVTS
ncbi:MAG: sugar phosphate isomerase/epimerase [Verrucomicrobia bacterium]|nr:sugar phosphate isomerase/epimerase [Verrucomicrobiota bacterium]